MLDYNLIFDGTPPTTGVAITTTRVSTNVLDLSIGRDLGTSHSLEIHVDILTALTGGTSLQIDFEGSADNSTYYTMLFSPVVLAAQLIQGCPIFRYAWPLNQALNTAVGIPRFPIRYARLTYTVAGTFTAGTVFAWANASNDRQQFYAPAANYVTH